MEYKLFLFHCVIIISSIRTLLISILIDWLIDWLLPWWGDESDSLAPGEHPRAPDTTANI